MKTLTNTAKIAVAVLVAAAAVSGCKKQDADPMTPDPKVDAVPDAGNITPPVPGNRIPAPDAPAPAPIPMPEANTPITR